MRPEASVSSTPRRTATSAAAALAPLAVVVLTVALTVPWVSQGLDVTDDGGHLVDQRILLGNRWLPADPFGALYWLSDVAGAAWLALTDPLGLLGARLGWVALMAATALLAWFVVRRHLRDAAAVAATAVACAVALAGGTRMLVDYNRMPYLFILAGLALIGTPPAAAGRRGVLRPLFAGAAFALAGLARTPSFLALLLPFLPLFLRRALEGSWDRDRLRSALLALGGAGVLLALVTIVLAVRADLPALLALFAAAWDHPVHPAATLARVYLRDCAFLLTAVPGWLLLFAALRRLPSDDPRARALWGGAIAAVCAAAAALAVAAAGAPAASRRFVLAVVAGCLAALLASTAAAARGRLAPQQRLQAAALAEVLLLGLAAALFACAGSGDGLTKLVHGLWVPVPAALAVGGLTLRERAPRGAAALVWALGIGVAVGALAIRWSYPYRDQPERLLLTARVDHPRLRGIRTTRERAASVSSLLRELSARVRPGVPLLTAGGIPLVHYLAGTVPVPGTLWPEGPPAAALVRSLDAGWRQGRPLPPVVRARVDTTAPTWAHRPVGPARGRTVAPAIGRWLGRNGYVVAWSNAEFEILLPPAHPARAEAP